MDHTTNAEDRVDFDRSVADQTVAVFSVVLGIFGEELPRSDGEPHGLDQSQAAPRTPLESPWAARAMGVSMPSENV